MKTSTPNRALLRSLGTTLRTVRRSVPISLARLCAKSGVAMSCISVIERGDSNPTIDTISRLAVGVGTTCAGVLLMAEQLQNPQKK